MYHPREDSYMLEKEVKNFVSKLNKKQREKLKVLDIGSGSGIQALSCIKSGIKRENILCADIDSDCIKHLKKQKLNAIRSDLFSNISENMKFDLIIFNPPYLPKDKFDNKPDTTAGKRGNEIIIKFLRKAKKYLSKNGTISLLFSSLSKPKEILKLSEKLGYKNKKLSELGLFFEKLFVYEFKI